MLLAAHPEWQDRAHAEVLKVSGGDGAAAPDFDMVSRMRTVGMVVRRCGCSRRRRLLCGRPGKAAGPQLLKGTYLFVPMSTIHHDVATWGPTVRLFDPSRFRDGVAAACKHPQASFMPFGLSARTCLGQNLALVEVKTLVAVVLARFEFTLSLEFGLRFRIRCAAKSKGKKERKNTENRV
uniref:Cytochrome P450 n=1 Tax=Oryza meridionalis TaxID=40149 RepID=A0A0E0CY43_9ORYZ